MSTLWPRLPDAVAVEVWEKIRAGYEPTPAAHEPEQIYAPVGDRVPAAAVQALIDATENAARDHGYPESANDAARVRFDRVAAPIVRSLMDMSWSEAGSRGVWSFISLVALPHVTRWRFGTNNVERWIASDLTRHTWARLWWQAVVFGEDTELLNLLSESDLNQLLERRSIGGDPRLVRSLGWAIVDVAFAEVPRRYLIRDLTLRLRRWLAFIDVRALNDEQVRSMCSQLGQETLLAYRDRQSGA